MSSFRKPTALVLLLSSFVLYIAGCGSNEPSDPGTAAPEIPSPERTMLIDVSLFSPNSASKADAQSNAKLNFIAASTIVTVFNVAVLVNLSVPALATAAALSVEPTSDEEGKFRWEYVYNENGFNLTLELLAEVGAEDVAWQMFVTGNVGRQLDNFLWYDGTSLLDGSSGHWQFYNPDTPGENDPLARIDWQTGEGDDRTLTFLNNNDQSDRFNDTLTYALAGEEASMIFVQAATQSTIEVFLNTATTEGYLIAPGYKDGQKSCWDSSQEDVDCP